MVDTTIAMTTKDYFQERALAYDQQRSKGFLGWLRNNEKRAVLSLLNLKRGETVLDAGCGEGYYAQLAKIKGAKPFGLDATPDMIAQLKKKGIPGRVGDIEKISLGKNFDKIVCAGVLEFTRNPGDALKTLAQHLERKGKLVILYSRPSLGTLVYVLLHRLHGLKLKIISKKHLQNLLKAAGLHITTHKKLLLFGGVACAEHEYS